MSKLVKYMFMVLNVKIFFCIGLMLFDDIGWSVVKIILVVLKVW